MLVYNCDGLGDEIKVAEIANLIQQHHIITLLETRTGDYTKLLHHLQGQYSIFHAKDQSHTKGHGVAMLVHNSIRDFTTEHLVSNDIQAVWLQTAGGLFNVAGKVILGGVYIPPQGTHSAQAIEEWYSDLLMEFCDATQQAEHVIIMGDFNAHLPATSEFRHDHCDLLERFPALKLKRLQQSRQGRDGRRQPPQRQNRAGALLCEIASAGPMIITTGRGKGDVGQHTFQQQARTEHILVDPDLYEQITQISVDANMVASDHRPLMCRFNTTDFLKGVADPTLPGQQQQQQQQQRSQPPGDCGGNIKLSWKSDQQNAYTACLQQDPLQQATMAAIQGGSLDAANATLLGWITAAALDSGMAREAGHHRPTPSRNPGQPKRYVLPAWYNDECKTARAYLQGAIRRGDTHVTGFLRKHYNNLVRRIKRRYTRAQALILIAKLRARDKAAYKKLRQQQSRGTTPLSLDRLNQYMKDHYRATTGEEHMGRDAWFGTGDQPAPDIDQFTEWVRKHVNNLSHSACGFDGLPAEFIRHARTKDCKGICGPNVLIPVIASLFHAVYESGRCPVAWKVARLCPLYKKGDLLNPDNYRILAVNSVLYRLYANVVREIVTAWCVEHKKVPEEQFGFYPGRNTFQPMFILRHVATSARHFKVSNSNRVYTAFIDFRQAYDTIDRKALWKHLHDTGMPRHMLTSIRAMYDQDSYILVDGHKRTDPVHATVGVKQGCPLSPLLFSLYVNDITSFFADITARHGVEIHKQEGKRRVSHLMYADDLAFMSRTAGGLQCMLDRLHGYSSMKGLTVNVSKSHVMVFNSRGDIREVFRYGGDCLDIVKEFKYLGMIFDRNCNLKNACDAWGQRFALAIKDIRVVAKQHKISKDISTMLHLFQVYAISAGMYACQVWGTGMIDPNRDLDSSVELKHIAFLRRMLKLRNSCCKRAVLRDCGQKPMQYYWLRALLKFWNNSLVATDNTLLQHVVSADLYLWGCYEDVDCWSAQLGGSLQGLTMHCGGVDWSHSLKQVAEIDVRCVMEGFEQAYHSFWRNFYSGNVRAPNTKDRKFRTYRQWFMYRDHENPAPYLLSRIGYKHICHMAQFRLGSHNLDVEKMRHSGRFRLWQYRYCRRCSPAHLSTLSCKVDDEYHMLFDCEVFEDLRTSDQYAPLFNQIRSKCRGNMSVDMFMTLYDDRTVIQFIHDCLTRVDGLSNEMLWVGLMTQNNIRPEQPALG